MTSKLITTSLLNSIDWLSNSPASWKARAFTDLSDQLNRVAWTDIPDPIKFGLAFEDKVEKDELLRQKDGTEIVGSDLYKKVLTHCKGGSFQDVVKGSIEVDGEDYVLYGRIDILFDDLIIDLKTTKKYKKGKYLETPQHLIYCYLSNIKMFKYLIVEWAKYPVIKEVFIETYQVPTFEKVENLIKSRIRNAMKIINADSDLLKAYTENFCAKSSAFKK